jgi:hypothetical protein
VRRQVDRGDRENRSGDRRPLRRHGGEHLR